MLNQPNDSPLPTPTRNRPSRIRILAVLASMAVASRGLADAGDRHRIDHTVGLTETQRSAIRELESVVAEAIGPETIPGVALSIVTPDGVVWARAYGHADIEADRPVTLDTPFGIGSISKTFIGAALMTEIERGTVTLEQPVNEVLPFRLVNPRAPGQIEVRHIVTHSSGIRDHRKTYPNSYADGDPDPNFGRWLEAYLTPDGAHYNARGNFLAATPGERQHYSNIGATVGALIVEHVSGKPYRDLVRERLFDPLGMVNTGFMISDFPADTIAVPYERAGKSLQRLNLFGYPTYPDGQIRASVLDLSRYLQMLMSQGQFNDRAVLAPESVERLLSVVLEDASADERFGVYWVVGENGSAQHSGGDPGIAAVVGFNRDRGVGFALAINTDDLREYQRVVGRRLSATLKTFPLE